MVATLDNFLLRLGNPGRYQVFVLLLLCSNVFPLAFNTILVDLFTVTPKHRCKVPEQSPPKNETLPMAVVNGRVEFDECQMYSNPANKSWGLIECRDGWTYEAEGARDFTVTMEWDLVCSYKSLTRFSHILFYAGVTLGGPISGYLADKFGRKIVIMATLFLQAIFGVGVAFSDSYRTYLALRAIQGAVLLGLQLTSHTLMFELFSQKHRSVVAVVATSLGSFAIILAALASLVIGHWRYIELAVTLPSLAGVTYLWLVPESVRWLVTQKKLQQAEDVAEFYARYNQVSLPATLPHEIDWISRQLPLSCKAEKKADPRQLFRTPKLRKYSLIQFYAWFTIALAYQGVLHYIPSLGGSMYYTFLTIGGVALSSRLFLIFILPRYGRRILQCSCFIISGVLCILTSLLHRYSGDTLSVLAASVGCALFGLAFASASLTCLHLCTAELYPTVIRSFGGGACYFWEGFGKVLSPFILLLGKHMWQPFPMFFIGFIVSLAGLLTLMLPETLKVPLPDTVEDSENIETIYATRGRSVRNFLKSRESSRETVT